MATSKPDLTRIWAGSAAPADVVDPDTTTPGKFTAGWSQEKPPYQHFNFLQKQFTQTGAYLNEQGVGEWDSSTTYPIGGISKGSDNKLYIATVEQSNNDPVSDGGVNWSLLYEDYEEGTFTPSLTVGGSSTGITYSAQTGIYVKYGAFVAGSIKIILTNKGGNTGRLEIGGLPFAAASTHKGVGFTVRALNVTGWDTSANIHHRIDESSGSIVLTYIGATGTLDLNETNINNNSELLLSFFYLTNF